MTHFRCRRPLEIHAVRELVYLRHFEYPFVFVSNYSDSVSRNDIPIFDAVLRFDRLDNNILERIPLQVLEGKRLHVKKVLCPWAACKCITNLRPSERHDALYAYSRCTKPTLTAPAKLTKPQFLRDSNVTRSHVTMLAILATH